MPENVWFPLWVSIVKYHGNLQVLQCLITRLKSYAVIQVHRLKWVKNEGSQSRSYLTETDCCGLASGVPQWRILNILYWNEHGLSSGWDFRIFPNQFCKLRSRQLCTGSMYSTCTWPEAIGCLTVFYQRCTLLVWLYSINRKQRWLLALKIDWLINWLLEVQQTITIISGLNEKQDKTYIHYTQYFKLISKS